jgi:hypothetical protein
MLFGVNETDDDARPVARAVPDRAVLAHGQWARGAAIILWLPF